MVVNEAEQNTDLKYMSVIWQLYSFDLHCDSLL